MSTTWDLYCCLLPQCEASHICRLGFPIKTKWCFDQDVKVVPGATFAKRMCDRCGSVEKKLGRCYNCNYIWPSSHFYCCYEFNIICGV